MIAGTMLLIGVLSCQPVQVSKALDFLRQTAVTLTKQRQVSTATTQRITTWRQLVAKRPLTATWCHWVLADLINLEHGLPPSDRQLAPYFRLIRELLGVAP